MNNESPASDVSSPKCSTPVNGLYAASKERLPLDGDKPGSGDLREFVRQTR